MSAIFQIKFGLNVSIGGFKELIQNTVANSLLKNEFIEDWNWRLTDQTDSGDNYQVSCAMHLTKGEPSEWVPQFVQGQLLANEVISGWECTLLDHDHSYVFRID